MRGNGRTWPAALVVAAAGVVGWSERVAWRRSREEIPPDRLDPAAGEPGEVVLVLGYRSGRGTGPNFVQRWRTRVAVRSADPASATFVFSGAATGTGNRADPADTADSTDPTDSEAARMARYAVQVLGVPLERVVLEERARTTWENVAYSIPLIGSAPSVKIASNTFHAHKARHYLAQQAPELAARLRRARDYVPGELALVRPLLNAYEWSRSR